MNDPRTNTPPAPAKGNDIEERARQERRNGAIDDKDGGGYPPATSDKATGSPTEKRNERRD
jgi:hypothetical protein